MKSFAEIMSEEGIEKIAKVCHQANKAYCETIGDFSQQSWEVASKWQQDSAKKGVVFHLQAERKPSESHDSWMKEKLESGWVFGEVKDEHKKTHPCLVEYHLLPEEQQAKDYIFKSVVDAFKAMAGAWANSEGR